MPSTTSRDLKNKDAAKKRKYAFTRVFSVSFPSLAFLKSERHISKRKAKEGKDTENTRVKVPLPFRFDVDHGKSYCSSSSIRPFGNMSSIS
jgi:hypothetical protein